MIRKEYYKEYYLKNKEKIAKKNKKYYIDHKEKLAEQKKKWCKENPEKMKEHRKRYYIKNRERILEYDKQWKEKNPEYIKEYQREYRKKKRNFISNYKLSKGCDVCGYNKCASALDFHHNNGNKEYNIGGIARRISDTNKIKKEMEKCTVLCRNCHAELHERERK